MPHPYFRLQILLVCIIYALVCHISHKCDSTIYNLVNRKETCLVRGQQKLFVRDGENDLFCCFSCQSLLAANLQTGRKMINIITKRIFQS